MHISTCCARARTRGCVGAWVQGCMSAWVRGCVHAHMRVCVRVCVRASTQEFVHVWVQGAYKRVHVWVRLSMRALSRDTARRCVWMPACVLGSVYVTAGGRVGGCMCSGGRLCELVYAGILLCSHTFHICSRLVGSSSHVKTAARVLRREQIVRASVRGCVRTCMGVCMRAFVHGCVDRAGCMGVCVHVRAHALVRMRVRVRPRLCV